MNTNRMNTIVYDGLRIEGYGGQAFEQNMVNELQPLCVAVP